MAVFKVEGGHRLCGELIPQGAKNEALQILSAVLLTPDRVVVHNVPDILDVNKLIEMLVDLGVKVELLPFAPNSNISKSYAFSAKDINLDFVRSEEFRRKSAALRGSVMLTGPMLARFGFAYMPKPGGDKIGRRRLDTHLIGFEKLGAELNFEQGSSYFEVKSKGLKGCYMLLDEASVTGTANIVMAAVLAEGKTTIYNAAG